MILSKKMFCGGNVYFLGFITNIVSISRLSVHPLKVSGVPMHHTRYLCYFHSLSTALAAEIIDIFPSCWSNASHMPQAVNKMADILVCVCVCQGQRWLRDFRRLTRTRRRSQRTRRQWRVQRKPPLLPTLPRRRPRKDRSTVSYIRPL